MKVVMQCAASKDAKAGRLRTKPSDEVVFVADPADPALCTSIPGARHATPDDLCSEDGLTWRNALERYNEQSENPCKLLRAAELYTPKENDFRKLYRDLANAFGWDNFFILSAGWGLIRANFWTPDYNVTFSTQAKKKKPWAWRNTKDKRHTWADFNHLQDANIEGEEPIHFFGGKDYLPMFYALVKTCPGRKIVHYKGDIEQRAGFDYNEYKGPEKNRTWHYRAAKDFLDERKLVVNQVAQ
jgi:hypothetical protein